MSRSFFSRFKMNNLLSFDDIIFQAPIYGCAIGCNAIYSYGTKKECLIEVDKTYIYTKNGYTDFMMIDKMGKHYNVSNSFWYWKWDSIEEWNNMKENDILNIKYYGFRIPIFGFFPNVFYSKPHSANHRFDYNK